MSRLTEEQLDGMLQSGLGEIDTPEVSSDFDSRVRAGLAPQSPSWRSIWNFMRPALAPAGLSLAVTLAALIVIGTPKLEGATHPRGSTPPNVAAEPRSDRLRSVELDLERLDRATPALRSFGRIHRGDTGLSEPRPPHRRRGASNRIDGDGSFGLQTFRYLNREKLQS